jgi:hypothetical protein
MLGWRRRTASRAGVLDQHLRDEVAALTETVRSGRKPGIDKLAEVEALARLVELQSSVRNRRRLPVLVGVGALAIAIGLMLLKRVDTVVVEGMVRASTVHLTLGKGHVLALDHPLRTVAASGYTGIEGIPADSLRSPLAGLVAEPQSGGTLTLQQVTLPGSARLQVRRTGGRTALRVAEGQPGGRIHVSLDDSARVMVGKRDTLLFGLGENQTLLLAFGGRMFNLSFVSTDSMVELLSDVPVDSVSFAELRTPSEDLRSDVVLLSTIDGGELVFPEMRSDKVTLRAREHLHLQARALQVHRLRSEPGGIVIEFRAQASELAVGGVDARRDLRPSVLEWYAANRRLELARTVLVSSVVMGLALLTWWNGSRS